MAEEYISRREHEEFAKRMEIENGRICDENERQNHRLKELEENVRQISKLAANTDRLAENMSNMLKELKEQGAKIEKLEGRDGERWRQVTGYVLTAVIGIVIGLVVTHLGL